MNDAKFTSTQYRSIVRQSQRGRSLESAQDEEAGTDEIEDALPPKLA